MNRVAFLFCSCFPDFFFLPCSNQVTWRPKDLGPHSLPEASGLIRVDSEGAEHPLPMAPSGTVPGEATFPRTSALYFTDGRTVVNREDYRVRAGREGGDTQTEGLAFALGWQGAVPSIPLPSSSSWPPPRPPGPYGAHQLIPHSRKPRTEPERGYLATGWERTPPESPS